MAVWHWESTTHGAARFARPVRVSSSTSRAHLKALRSSLRAVRAAILSTCNRTEIYCAARRRHGPRWTGGPLGRRVAGLLRSHAYTLRDGLAARHAFRVASGLDSMVLGEPQILAS